MNEFVSINDRKYYLYRFYNLRSFFRSNLGNTDLAEFLLGHRNMSNRYFKKSQNIIIKDYLKYSHNLLLYTDVDYTKDTIERNQYIDTIKDRVKKSEELNKELRLAIDSYEKRFDNIEKSVNDLFEKKNLDFKETIPYFLSFMRALGIEKEEINAVEKLFPEYYTLVKDMSLNEFMNDKDKEKIKKKMIKKLSNIE